MTTKRLISELATAMQMAAERDEFESAASFKRIIGMVKESKITSDELTVKCKHEYVPTPLDKKGLMCTKCKRILPF